MGKNIDVEHLYRKARTIVGPKDDRAVVELTKVLFWNEVLFDWGQGYDFVDRLGHEFVLSMKALKE